MSETVDLADRDRWIDVVGFVKHNGAGEIIFRQSGHPTYNDALVAEGWTAVQVAS